MAEKVALFGGSFNPIHIGHLITAQTVAEVLGLSRVFLIPCARPPHKWPHELASAVHRIEMARLAIEGEPGLAVSDIEIRQDRLNYPIQAIELFCQDLGADAQVNWIVGSDAVSELRTWHRLPDMIRLCRIVIAARSGFQMPDLASLREILSHEQVDLLARGLIETPQVEISATQIRQRVRERRSIRYLVPEAVLEYIEDRGLYLPASR